MEDETVMEKDGTDLPSQQLQLMSEMVKVEGKGGGGGGSKSCHTAVQPGDDCVLPGYSSALGAGDELTGLGTT